MGKASPSRKYLIITSLVAGAAIVFDIFSPANISGGSPYIALVLAALWLSERRHILLLAAFASLLTIAGYFLSPDGVEPWVAAANRGLTVLVIWAVALVIIGYRVSEKEVQHNKARLEAVIDTAVDGFMLIDSNGLITDFNPACEQLFGYRKEEVLDIHLHTLIPSEKGEISNSYLDLYLRVSPMGEPRISQEVTCRRKDGSNFPGEFSVGELVRGGGNVYVCIVRDITKRKRLEAELRHLSRTDGLTGVANRRKFDETLDIEWRRHARDKQALSLLLVDVDFFKSYNDTFGHQKGDECLKEIANTLQMQVRRASDLVARYGGEEFAVILPGTSEPGALWLAQKSQKMIHDLNIAHPESDAADRLTISIGVGSLVPGKDDAPSDLITLADKALYRAKAVGRNCIVLASGEIVTSPYQMSNRG